MIKITMGDKSTIVSPEWLLEHSEEDVPELLVCNGCDTGGDYEPESYEPTCYGECVDEWLKKLKDSKIKFEEVCNE